MVLLTPNRLKERKRPTGLVLLIEVLQPLTPVYRCTHFSSNPILTRSLPDLRNIEDDRVPTMMSGCIENVRQSVESDTRVSLQFHLTVCRAFRIAPLLRIQRGLSELRFTTVLPTVRKDQSLCLQEIYVTATTTVSC